MVERLVLVKRGTVPVLARDGIVEGIFGAGYERGTRHLELS
jgi:hypothetical protein